MLELPSFFFVIEGNWCLLMGPVRRGSLPSSECAIALSCSEGYKGFGFVTNGFESVIERNHHNPPLSRIWGLHLVVPQLLSYPFCLNNVSRYANCNNPVMLWNERRLDLLITHCLYCVATVVGVLRWLSTLRGFNQMGYTCTRC